MLKVGNYRPMPGSSWAIFPARSPAGSSYYNYNHSWRRPGWAKRWRMINWRNCRKRGLLISRLLHYQVYLPPVGNLFNND